MSAFTVGLLDRQRKKFDFFRSRGTVTSNILFVTLKRFFQRLNLRSIDVATAGAGGGRRGGLEEQASLFWLGPAVRFAQSRREIYSGWGVGVGGGRQVARSERKCLSVKNSSMTYFIRPSETLLSENFDVHIHHTPP